MLQNKANSTNVGAICLIIFLPCMWGLGFHSTAACEHIGKFQRHKIEQGGGKEGGEGEREAPLQKEANMK